MGWGVQEMRQQRQCLKKIMEPECQPHWQVQAGRQNVGVGGRLVSMRWVGKVKVDNPHPDTKCSASDSTLNGKIRSTTTLLGQDRRQLKALCQQPRQKVPRLAIFRHPSN